MIVGIVSIPLVCCALLGLVAGIAGVVMGILGRKQTAERGEKGAGMALAGIITGGVGVLLSIASMIFGVANYLNN
jgi:hypothetical protein